MGLGTASATAGVSVARGPVAFVVVAKGITPIRTATNSAGRLIKLPGGTGGNKIVFTPNGKTAYVDSDGKVGVVIPISIATRKPGKPIKVGGGPLGIGMTPDGKTVYSFNVGYTGPGGTVTPINTATNKPGRAIRVGNSPWAMASAPDSKTAYVVSLDSHTVTPINTATSKAGKPINVGPETWAIAITPNGRTAYVAGLASRRCRTATGRS